MIRIGIIGAENTHSLAIAKTLNVQKAVAGCRVTAIWGETDEFAAKTAAGGQIPTVVKEPTDLLGKIDALVVDHRHARFHLPAAEAFLKTRTPMFIDKPFCYRLAEGKAFLKRAARLGVPVTSFSTIPFQKSFQEFLKRVGKSAVRAVASSGPADLQSPWGGIFFYGVHQVEALLEAVGIDVEAVAVTRAKGRPNAVATLYWKNGLTAAMTCLKDAGGAGFQFLAVTDAGPDALKALFDENPYLTGIRAFCKMFKTGKEPLAHRRILAPVAVLEALEKAVDSGTVEKVATF